VQNAGRTDATSRVPEICTDDRSPLCHPHHNIQVQAGVRCGEALSADRWLGAVAERRTLRLVFGADPVCSLQPHPLVQRPRVSLSWSAPAVLIH